MYEAFNTCPVDASFSPVSCFLSVFNRTTHDFKRKTKFSISCISRLVSLCVIWVFVHTLSSINRHLLRLFYLLPFISSFRFYCLGAAKVTKEIILTFQSVYTIFDEMHASFLIFVNFILCLCSYSVFSFVFRCDSSLSLEVHLLDSVNGRFCSFVLTILMQLLTVQGAVYMRCA